MNIRTSLAGRGQADKLCVMDAFYLLLHNPSETGKVKVIGVYSTEELAVAAMERARVLPGFADEADGFTIGQIDVDKDQWPRGFVRL